MAFICEIKVFNKQTKEWNDNLKYIKNNCNDTKKYKACKTENNVDIVLDHFRAHHMYVSFI